MRIIEEKWSFPTCNVDVGASVGEQKNNKMRKVYATSFETRFAGAA